VERPIGPPPELDAVVDEHRERDHHRLPRLEAVDAGEDVDRVGAEDREARHEAVVRDAELDRRRQPQVAEERKQELRQHDDGAAAVDGVHHHDRQRRRQRQPQLVAPAQIEHVVGEAEEAHAADREQRAQKLGEVRVREAVRRRRRRRRRRAPRAAAADRQVVREGERDEDEHADQVHRAGDQPHRLRHLRALHRPHERAARVALRLRLVQVDPEEPRLDERRAHREREPRRDDVPEAREQHAHRERRRRPKVARPQQRRRRADRGGEHERLVLRERHRKFGGGLESVACAESDCRRRQLSAATAWRRRGSAKSVRATRARITSADLAI